jgi:multicomponent Na+:H+ antiporter subunit D
MVLAPMSVLALANIYFFFHADPLVGLARAAANAVMGGN